MNQRYPLLGTSVIDGRSVEFTWLLGRPILSLTFANDFPPLIGQVSHLDGLPRFHTAPDNLDWVEHEQQRTLELIDQAIHHYRRRDRIARFCKG
jgi:hypothetical protein